MNTDLLKKINYMINMESGANFEYLASVEESNGHSAIPYLQKAQEKYGLAESYAVTDKEMEDSKKATKRVIDRVVSSKYNIR